MKPCIRINVVLLTLALLALLGALCAAYRANAQEPGKKPVDFSLPDITGKTIKLADYRGKVVVVDFWATWCGFCVREIPEITSLQAEAIKHKTPLQFIGVSVDRDKEAARRFAQDHKMNYPVVYNDPRATSAFGNVTLLPTTFILNKQGVIVDKIIGAVSQDELQKRIAPYLK
jgi:peroxiredoxin